MQSLHTMKTLSILVIGIVISSAFFGYRLDATYREHAAAMGKERQQTADAITLANSNNAQMTSLLATISNLSTRPIKIDLQVPASITIKAEPPPLPIAGDHDTLADDGGPPASLLLPFPAEEPALPKKIK